MLREGSIIIDLCEVKEMNVGSWKQDWFTAPADMNIHTLIIGGSGAAKYEFTPTGDFTLTFFTTSSGGSQVIQFDPPIMMKKDGNINFRRLNRESVPTNVYANMIVSIGQKD